jgi:hypothetical protein
MDQHFAAMDALLVRLETKTATEFRHLRWGLGIVIARAYQARIGSHFGTFCNGGCKRER